MTIDWGYKVPEIKQLNPVYASWLYDWNVLGQLYDSLLVRNASDLGSFLPWTASDYEVGTYTHPTLGECSKIKFRLRSDLNWNDGMNLTVADVFFTFVELKAILSSRGFPNPWWWSNVQDILSFSILDAYTFEVLLGVKSYWALGWIGGNIILPKHIWKPIAETGDPQADQPDTALICSGPWQFHE
jgi:ABC-type transport system substrate-binding protein